MRVDHLGENLFMKPLRVNADLMAYNQSKVVPHQLINSLYNERFNPFVGKICILLIYWSWWPRERISWNYTIEKSWLFCCFIQTGSIIVARFWSHKKRLKQDYIFPRVFPALIILPVQPAKISTLILFTQVADKTCTYRLQHCWKYLAKQAWCDWANIFYILPFHILWQLKHANGWLHPLHDKD